VPISASAAAVCAARRGVRGQWRTRVASRIIG
jgi:hypothetical protein